MPQDEATASVDSETDGLIQSAVHTACTDTASRTLVVIAHRLETIMDCDRVLVLSAGRLVEMVNPAAAIKAKSGAFYELLQSAHGAVVD